ncbi:hypothetical protein GCM10023144_00430 [Pigmentiphaga soli]|uniref:AzlD domain-containing protein n=1 Tax=Pigmentiphaga soli TaxID=1007095 RepID=A0ABP8GC85_9BURK
MTPGDGYVWLAIAALTACTVVARSGFLLLGDYMPLPDIVRRALRYAPAAALAAIVVPELFPWGAAPPFDFKPLAAVVAVAVMAYTRSTAAMIVAGMAALWLLRWIFGT